MSMANSIEPRTITAAAERRSPDHLVSTATAEHDHEYTLLRFVFSILPSVDGNLDTTQHKRPQCGSCARRHRPRQEFKFGCSAEQAGGAFPRHRQPLPQCRYAGTAARRRTPVVLCGYFGGEGEKSLGKNECSEQKFPQFYIISWYTRIGGA
jgi:hypothetical protein